MPRSGSKRPIAEVIDLTLSDDDEPIPPPTKRQNLGTSTVLATGVNLDVSGEANGDYQFTW